MTNDLLDSYLVRFQSALVGMTLAERQDIVEEIRVHVEERNAAGMSVEEALARLGPADELAREYCRGALVRRAGALVRRASTAFSPWVILKAAFAWAMTGVHGMGVFAVALIGYGLGFAFAALAVMKFFFPEATGFWVGDGQAHFGFPPPNGREAQEFLGTWFQPVVVGMAALLLAGTTALMRKLMAKFRYWRASALNVRPEPGPCVERSDNASEDEPSPPRCGRPAFFWMPPPGANPWWWIWTGPSMRRRRRQ
ncbi:MAG: hypothetical protein LAQ30_31305 [Acidobacteriia bacterium]|nr:hypothetical protein [Terriglobia bacterium]